MTEKLLFTTGDGASNILAMNKQPETKETPTLLKIKTGVDTPTKLDQYKIFDILPDTDPRLRQVSQPVDFNAKLIPGTAEGDPVYLAISLFETMFKNKGLGLAAIQIGVPLRVFTVGYDMTNKQVFFNPTITETSTEKHIDFEGCLSYNGLFLKVERPQWIRVKYQHVNGDWREDRYDGLTARCICHEMDHLDGITFTTRVPKTSLMIAMEKRRKLIKKQQREGKKQQNA